MFHWICPECGREIAPGVKDCTACDPQAAPAPAAEIQVTKAVVLEPSVAEEVKALIPEIVGADPEGHLREIAGKMLSTPSAMPTWTTPSVPKTGVQPISTPPPSPVSAPAMVRQAPAHVPDVADRVEDAALREPAAASPERAPVLGAFRGAPRVTALFQKPALPPAPKLGSPETRVPGTAPIESIEEQMAAGIPAVAPPRSKVFAGVAPEESLPGPRLPHELASFQGAGISHILRVVPDAPRPSLGAAIPGWVVTSLVTATLLAGALSFAFYAMPGLASPRAKTVSTAPVETIETPTAGSPLLEVTGIRFVAGTRKGPEIHYLVVNHSGAPLDGTTVNVTLRLNRAAAGTPPISRFSFTATGLGAYESREMVSPIQNMVSPAQLPDWRDLRADVEVGQSSSK